MDPSFYFGKMGKLLLTETPINIAVLSFSKASPIAMSEENVLENHLGILLKQHFTSPTHKIQFDLVILWWAAFNSLPICWLSERNQLTEVISL